MIRAPRRPDDRAVSIDPRATCPIGDARAHGRPITALDAGSEIDRQLKMPIVDPVSMRDECRIECVFDLPRE